MCSPGGGGDPVPPEGWNAATVRLIADSRCAEPGLPLPPTNSSARSVACCAATRLGPAGVWWCAARRGDLGVAQLSVSVAVLGSRCSAGPTLRLLISVSASPATAADPHRSIFIRCIGQTPFCEGWLRACPGPADCFDLPPRPPSAAPTRLPVYLDGTTQVERDITACAAPCWRRSSGALDPGTVLLKGMRSYTVLPVEAGRRFWWQCWLLRRCLPCRRSTPLA